MKILLTAICFLLMQKNFAQDSSYAKPNKQRVIILGVTNAAVTTGTMAALYNIWYKDYRSSILIAEKDTGCCPLYWLHNLPS